MRVKRLTVFNSLSAARCRNANVPGHRQQRRQPSRPCQPGREAQREAESHARIFRQLLPSQSPVMEILGPTAALIWKLRNQYRYQIVIKNSRTADPGGKLFYAIFSDAYERYHAQHGRNSVQIIVDVDAQGMG